MGHFYAVEGGRFEMSHFHVVDLLVYFFLTVYCNILPLHYCCPFLLFAPFPLPFLQLPMIY